MPQTTNTRPPSRVLVYRDVFDIGLFLLDLRFVTIDTLVTLHLLTRSRRSGYRLLLRTCTYVEP